MNVEKTCRFGTTPNKAFKLAGRGLSDIRRSLEVLIHEVNQERKSCRVRAHILVPKCSRTRGRKYKGKKARLGHDDVLNAKRYTPYASKNSWGFNVMRDRYESKISKNPL